MEDPEAIHRDPVNNIDSNCYAEQIEELINIIRVGRIYQSVAVYSMIEDDLTNDQKNILLNAYVDFMEKNREKDIIKDNMTNLNLLCAVFAGNRHAEYNKTCYLIKNILGKK